MNSGEIIRVQGEKSMYECQIIRRKRMRSIRMRMSAENIIIVSCATSIPQYFIKDLLLKNLASLDRQFTRRPKAILPSLNSKDKKAHTENVRALVCSRALEIAPHLFKLAQNISVGASRTRWGTCSSQRNLRFHYKLAFLPAHLVDYVVAHELTHLVELNHGAGFWQLLENILPNARAHRKELKKYNLE